MALGAADPAGLDVFTARKLTLLACALCTVPVFLAPQVESIWTAVGLIGLAMAAHQGFSANLFTLVSDTMPKGAVAGAVGLGGAISSVLSGFSAKLVGRLLDATGGNYTLVFFVGAGAYVVASARCTCCCRGSGAICFREWRRRDRSAWFGRSGPAELLMSPTGVRDLGHVGDIS